ncbi:phosphatidylglycerophosphatase and protein-tyrosine phosphatase 1 isoform X1 [Anabrus simplex]|uniref:phosphatidylglycerophosphatase and protein-tyrosine phosphatase 1 isoform X1 n=1 Tax=Anabrus simplex TaxID=316456 RepID=UPI0034DD5919
MSPGNSSCLFNIIARFTFFPTLLYNIVLEKLSVRRWYDRIDDLVLLGALPPKRMVPQLLKENVKAVVSMNQSYELMICMNRKEDWERNNIEFLQLSTVDMFAAPTQEKLLKGVAFINKFEGSGGSVYVHCKAGRSRSAVLVGCYLMQKYGWNPEEAASFMMAKRHQVSLRSFHWKALYLYYFNIIQKSSE